jgi:hypothetical protein
MSAQIRLSRTENRPQNAPAELGDRLAPTVYGLVHCGRGDQMVKVFLASVQVGYARQRGFLPDRVKVKPVTLSSDALITGVRQIIGRPFGEGNPSQVRLMLAGEPATWLGVSPDPDAPDWEWKLWFGSLRPFAVDTGPDYLAALEQLIGRTFASVPPHWPTAAPKAVHHPHPMGALALNPAGPSSWPAAKPGTSMAARSASGQGWPSCRRDRPHHPLPASLTATPGATIWPIRSITSSDSTTSAAVSWDSSGPIVRGAMIAETTAE